MLSLTPTHPVEFHVDHLDWPHDRVATLLRGVWAIPILVLASGLVVVPAATIASWVAIVTTGRHPRRLFDFTVGVMRWHNRVVAHPFALAADSYPPFRLSA